MLLCCLFKLFHNRKLEKIVAFLIECKIIRGCQLSILQGISRKERKLLKQAIIMLFKNLAGVFLHVLFFSSVERQNGFETGFAEPKAERR